LQNATVVDCVPTGLEFTGYLNPSTGSTPVAGDGSNGCATGYTRIGWDIGALAVGGSTTLTYTATVVSSPAGGLAYKNLAILTGWTLDASKDPGHAKSVQVTAQADHTVTVSGATIQKAADPTSLAPGQPGSFTVTVTIPAHVAFYDSAVMDQLPGQMTFGITTSHTCTNADATDCGSAIPWTPLGPSSNVLGWVVGDLGTSDQARTIKIVYTATMNASGNSAGSGRMNTAHYRWNTSNGSDPTSPSVTWGTSGVYKGASVTVIEPSMSIAKTVNGAATATVAPDDTFTYVVTATNASTTNAAPAYNVTVTDAVPAGVIVNPSSLTASAGVLTGTAADGSGGTITWTIAGPLAKGASLTFRYTGTLVASSRLRNTDTETNTATVTRYESQLSGGKTYTGPNTSATLSPKFPHVTPTKTVASGPAYLGQSKAWTITLTSDGKADAQHVSATDTLPMNWTYDTGTARVVVEGVSTQVEPGLSLDAAGHQVLTWNDLGTAQPTKTIVITFTATPKDPEAVDAPGVGSGVAHTNTVSTTAKDATGATGNASGAYNGGPASVSTHIDSADLKIVKTSDGNAVAGENLTYTLTVSNATTGDTAVAVGGFTVVDNLPTGLGTVTATGSDWTCRVTPDPDTPKVTCTSTATKLDPGKSLTPITVTAAIPSGTVGGTQLKNSATVSATTHDPNTTNNTDSVTDKVTRSVDLQIVKAVSSSPVVAGQNLTYTLDVKNNGPSDSVSDEFVVTDSLPSGLSYVAAAGSGWSCAESPADSGEIRCITTAAPKVNGTLPTITVTAKVAAGVTGEIVNTATVVGPEPTLDLHPDNNSSTAKVTPSTSADLKLVKKADAGTWTSGSTHTYTLDIYNLGPSEAKGVRIADALPASVTYAGGSFVGSSSATWNCSATSGNSLDCTRSGSLPLSPDADTPVEHVSFQVTVKPDHVGPIYNEATVGASTRDPDASNNTGHVTVNTDQKADLGITKAGPATATAGGHAVEFTLQVRNYGDSDSPAPDADAGVPPITVTDTLPAGMKYVGWTGSDWTCSASGQVVTCTLGVGLQAGHDAQELKLTVTIGSGVGAGNLVNRAGVRGPLNDPKDDNDSAQKTVELGVSPSLTIVKSANPATVRAGERVTYTITVESTGPSDATGVHVLDPLATGLTFVSISEPSGWDCSKTAADCTIGRLAAGDSATFKVVADVSSGVTDGAEIPNSATVTANGGLTKTHDAKITVVAEADLELAKSHDHPDEPVLAGQSVTFTLKAHNNGPSDAQPNVKIVDTLPAGMTFAGSTGVWDCSATGQVVTCVLPGNAVVVAKQDAPALTITATIDAALDPTTTSLTNTAVVSSGTTDPVHDNNTATDPVKIGYQADLSIGKAHDAAAVRVGDPLTFTLQVANAGPSVAKNAVVTDTIPDSLDYVSSDGGADWTCTFTAPKLECAANADLSVGTPGAITVTTTVKAAAYPSVENTAKVTSDTTDPDATNNAATDTVTVPPKVDLSITKTHGPEPLQVGQQGTYTLTVANSGPTDDPGTVTVTDSLPAGLTFVSGTGEGWTCSAAGQDVTCGRPDGLASDHTSVITLVVDIGPEAYPEVTNTASVSSPAEDTDPGNNAASDPATVLPLYSLSLAKSVKSVSGSTVSWTLAVANAGPNVAPTGASFVDTLPAELTYTGASGDGWTCSAAGQVVTCDHPGAIASGAMVSVVLVTTVASGFSGELVNQASLSGDTQIVTATVDIPKNGGDLAYTGGVALGGGVLGLLLVGGGLLLIRIRRRHA
jgi:uncharacterized repeat protein (TIGR01451 family)/fimbrial isopeptide formation D2 family protein